MCFKSSKLKGSSYFEQWAMYQEQVRGNKNNRNNKGVKYNNYYNTNNSNTNNSNNYTNTNDANNKKINKKNILNHTIIKQELEEIKDKGLEVYINGDPYDINKINEICLVLEENYYMKDYISNYEGKIVEVHYDKII